MAKLILKFGPAVVKEFPVPPTQTSVALGRKSDNDLVIDNPVVSGHHARIIKQGDTFFVEDLNSTNGTFIGGRKILKSGLTHGDEITIASHSVIFLDDGVKPAAPPPEAKPPAIDQTMVIDPAQRDALLKKQPTVTPAPAGKVTEKVGTFVVTSGTAERSEFELTGLVTYAGKSDNAHVKLKGLFVPEMGAAINKRQEGYVLVALKDGFPEVNGQKLTGQVVLQDGDEVKMAGVTFRFYVKEISR
ncbi:MAG: hypothetical protein CVU77_04205 [Elusimicrobia bacterium HGW-Elusimicrobia-1]|jgi:pSer/pThr/pTyr-binding forkhead associated (FHA) protein|nr:MAG: hypothetical protein CVU77_04205 [Elusimicrobia bacterium HGW-Elusimicrobia-1]